MELSNNDTFRTNNVPEFSNNLWSGPQLEKIVQSIKPEYFKSKRWFGSKTREITDVTLLDYALLQEQPAPMGMVLLQINYAEGAPEEYHLPLLLQLTGQETSHPADLVTTLTVPEGELNAYDAFTDDSFCKALYQSIYENRQLSGAQGKFRFAAISGGIEQPQVETIKRISTEQSNTSIIVNSKLIMKGFRKLSHGQNPDVEIPLFLTNNTSFKYVPRLAGYIEYDPPSGPSVSMGLLQDFVKNGIDAYIYTLQQLREDYFKQVEPVASPDLSASQLKDQARQLGGSYATAALRLGQITGELHSTLASEATRNNSDFVPQSITEADTRQWEADISQLIERVITSVQHQIDRYPVELRQPLEAVVQNKSTYLQLVKNLNVLTQEGVNKIRFHGDYHLQQVLKTGDDFVILDFEGEPARSLEYRRARNCCLKDVAGMLRSLNYAAYSGFFEAQDRVGKERAATLNLEQWALAWEEVARNAFLQGYREATGQPSTYKFLPDSEAAFWQALSVFELEKAFYELNYEFNNRPTWVPIPLQGLLRIASNQTV
jgi:maltose alpha-D-glucosyltransferase/alpha-amylase